MVCGITAYSFALLPFVKLSLAMEELAIAPVASSTCLLAWDQSFGPRVNTFCRSFDFTLQFEDVIFACLPAVVFICLLPWNIFRLLKSSPTCSVQSKLQISKLVGGTHWGRCHRSNAHHIYYLDCTRGTSHYAGRVFGSPSSQQLVPKWRLITS